MGAHDFDNESVAKLFDVLHGETPKRNKAVDKLLNQGLQVCGCPLAQLRTLRVIRFILTIFLRYENESEHASTADDRAPHGSLTNLSTQNCPSPMHVYEDVLT